MNLKCCFLSLLFASALAPAVALAQVPDGDKAAARQLTIDGNAALQRRDYAGAADLFKRADALFHAPTITLGLARSHAGLGKLLAAQEYYNRLVHETLVPGAAEAFVRAIDDGRTELAALSPRIPSLIVQVRGAAPSRVVLDGAAMPAAVIGVKRPVDPGRHTVRAVARGFTPASAPVDVVEGGTATVTLDLVAAPPGASDGVDDAEPAAGGSTQRTAGFVGIGVGAAGLAVGAILLGVDAAKHSSLIAQCPSGTCPIALQPTLQGGVSTYHTLGIASTTSLVAGGALAVTGAILVLVTPKAQPRAVGVVPLVGPGFIGVSGRFQ